MSDDPLRDALLRETEQDLPQLDPRVERLVAGELSPAEEAALRAAAADDPLLALALSVATPWDDAATERAARRVEIQYRRAPEPAPRPWWRALAILLVPAAVAAALLIARPAPRDALPPYTATWASGERDVRGPGPQPAVPTFTAGSRVEVVLRPAIPATAESRVELAVDGVALDARAEASPDGAWRVRGVVGEAPWTLAPGAHTLTVAVGPADVPRGRAWQVVDLPFVVR